MTIHETINSYSTAWLRQVFVEIIPQKRVGDVGVDPNFQHIQLPTYPYIISSLTDELVKSVVSYCPLLMPIVRSCGSAAHCRNAVRAPFPAAARLSGAKPEGEVRLILR